MGEDVLEFAAAVAIARNGVDYSPRLGAVCPSCGTERALVTGCTAWDSGYKVRYHKCRNKVCPMAVANVSIKSIERDYVTPE